MTLLHALAFGLVQGLGEFLPISSSAHLVLLPWVFGWPDPGLSFDVALHLGTLIAVVWYFRSEWFRLARAAVALVARGGRIETAADRMVIALVIATIPGAIAGKLLERAADEAFRSPALIATTLMVMGVLLWVVDLKAPMTRPLDSVGWRDALIMGVAQIFALVPGVSRSGSTITAGRALRLDRDSAAIFSFLMSGPIIAGAAVLKLPTFVHAGGLTTPVLAAVAASAISGWLAIAVLLRFVKSHSYGAFAVYRLVFGACILALVLLRGGRNG